LDYTVIATVTVEEDVCEYRTMLVAYHTNDFYNSEELSEVISRSNLLKNGKEWGW
jgi:hypothetical protein